jgi:hypothetical protein
VRGEPIILSSRVIGPFVVEHHAYSPGTREAVPSLPATFWFARHRDDCALDGVTGPTLRAALTKCAARVERIAA